MMIKGKRGDMEELMKWLLGLAFLVLISVGLWYLINFLTKT